MQAAKDAVKKFTSKDGRDDTTVHERVAPAVTQETVARQQEDRVTTAVDKEVHQDHYHTSVQPVKDSQVLSEQHHHRMGEVEHRTFDHNDTSATKERLQTEASQFKDSTTRVEGQTTSTIQPSIGGEHVHHHVHETIQPVVNKQTVEPHVVHHTIPVHEVHHNSAQHHSTSTLPAVSMSEFERKGGQLGGRGERTDEFDGPPRHAGGAGSTSADKSGRSAYDNTSSGMGVTGSSGLGGTSGVTGNNSSSYGNDRLAGTSTGVGGPTGTTGTTGTSSTSTSTGKPSMMDRLNPKKDADGDGKTGFMS